MTALAFLPFDLQHPHLVIVDASKMVHRIGKQRLPVVVMTGDADPRNQSQRIRLGANDLAQKPVEARLLITKLLFQLRMGRRNRQHAR